MSIRLMLQGGGASPMRVLASGADPNNAQFGDLLFDANYRALRVGQISILNTSLPSLSGQSIVSTPLFKTFPTPPLVTAMMLLTTPTGTIGRQLPTAILPPNFSPLNFQSGAG